MECYQHPGHGAVGICKHCSKAVCRECVRETVGGLACCEAGAEANIRLHAITGAAVKAYGIGEGKRSPPSAVVMPALLGLGFLLFGLWDMFSAKPGIAWFMAPMGLLFLFGAWYAWRKFKSHGINV